MVIRPFDSFDSGFRTIEHQIIVLILKNNIIAGIAIAGIAVNRLVESDGAVGAGLDGCYSSQLKAGPEISRSAFQIIVRKLHE